MDIAAYVGGESSLAGHARVIKLSSNENPLGPSPQAVAAYRSEADRLHQYPDGGASKLRDAIARRFGPDPTGIVCGSGSDALLRSEERRGGKEGVSPCRSRWSPDHKKQKQN